MIPYEEAYEQVINSTRRLGVEIIDFGAAINRVLAEDIVSDLNMPPFDKSAMDGYACRAEDLQHKLEVIEVIPAGATPQKEIGPYQCAKIMTGAPVPKGADTVIMVEYTRKIDEHHIEFLKEKSKSNICLLGEDVKTGDILLKKGTLIQAKHIPVLAMVGATRVSVYSQPSVAIVSTGNELIEPQFSPDRSQIRNSNAYQLMAQTKALNLPVHYLGIAKDSIEDTRTKMREALNLSDVIIMSGAVSMGDYDYVPQVLQEEGFTVHFHGVSTKPGKKTIFATKDKHWFIGVPGNPVSAFVQFELLIKPLLLGIMGNHEKPRFIKMPIENDFHRKNAFRKAFEPVVITNQGKVRMVTYHGSAHISALSYADGLMVIEKDIKDLNEGDLVDVRPI